MRHRAPTAAVCIAVSFASVTACGSGGARPMVTVVPTSTTVARPVAAPDLQAVLDDARTAVGAKAALAAVDRGTGIQTFVSGDGERDRPPLGSQTTFRTGSITKVVVAALALDAVRRGELTLDADVSTLLPGVLRPGPAVTVRHLLDHTSGIFNVGDEGDVIADMGRLTDPTLSEQGRAALAHHLAGEPVLISADLYVALAETHDRYFAPGGGFHYSNVNYQLAAMVLEHVTGQKLPGLFARRVAGPLDLQHTTIAVDTSVLPQLHGFRRARDGTTTDDTMNVISLGNGGSGGLVSTPAELTSLLRAITSGQILGEHLTAEMRQPTRPSDGSYGLGLATYELRCGQFLGHGGSISGTNSIALVSPDGHRSLVVVVNIDSDPDPNMAAIAESILCG